jgi:ABC-type Fe3+-citrate transport system substrate-binding protein
MVTELKVIAPVLESQVGIGNFGPISSEHTQDAKEIAKVCGKKDEFLTQLKEKNLARIGLFSTQCPKGADRISY